MKTSLIDRMQSVLVKTNGKGSLSFLIYIVVFASMAAVLLFRFIGGIFIKQRT
jgi:hypothetical protein